jgi:hypothetical protein
MNGFYRSQNQIMAVQAVGRNLPLKTKNKGTLSATYTVKNITEVRAAACSELHGKPSKNEINSLCNSKKNETTSIIIFVQDRQCK